MGGNRSTQRKSPQIWGERSNCISKAAPGSKPRTPLPWGEILNLKFKFKCLVESDALYVISFHLFPNIHFILKKKKTFCNMPSRFVHFLCVCKHLFMEACLQRAVPSQSAQSSELWGNWWVVRGWSLRLIIRCFYCDLPSFTMISLKRGNTGPLQAPGSQASLLHWSFL